MNVKIKDTFLKTYFLVVLLVGVYENWSSVQCLKSLRTLKNNENGNHTYRGRTVARYICLSDYRSTASIKSVLCVEGSRRLEN